MFGCVARIMTPGSQFDTVLTLVGPGGWHKSTFFKRIAVDPDWYRGNTPAIADPQKVGLALRGHWIVELGELTTMRSAQREAFLEFITRTEEKFRAPYEKCEVTEKRQCGIGATANTVEFLSALDGAIQRRFLPIEVKKIIDTDWVTAHRDELWAEAFAAWSAGEPWWIENEATITRLKDNFKDETPIEEKLSVFLASNPNRALLSGKSATEIFEIVFGDPQRKALPTPAQRQEVGRFMKKSAGVIAKRECDRRFYEVTPLPGGDPPKKVPGPFFGP
jgi:predicted P-loop ATPase